jgi:hypothetical protein
VPKELASPVAVPEKELETNSDLADYIIMLKSALNEANRRLEAIGDL